MQVKGWLIGYIVCAILHLLSLALGWEWMRFVTKPLLMLILLFAGARPWVNAALFFSWVGDIFLLGEGLPYFMAGLAAFLLAHCCYIVFFNGERRRKQPRPNWNIYTIVGMSLYIGIFYFFLAPHLPEALKVPVFVYSCVIATMFVFAGFSNLFCVVGAALFLISDSLLAINSFISPFTGAALLIMTSYAAAQGLIVWGSLDLNKKG